MIKAGTLKLLSLLLLCASIFTATPVFSIDEGDTSEWTSQEVCKNVCFPRLNGGLFSCHQECNYYEEVKLPGGIDFLVKRMREKMFPPVIEKMVTDPEQPVSGKKLSITLEPRQTALDLLESYRVKFFYSYDTPKDWKNSVFDFESESRTWTTALDIPSGHEKMYMLIRAGDNDGNTYIELPCETKTPFIGSEDCFFPLSKDDTFKNSEEFSIDPALDITDSFIAADPRRYYFRVKTLADIDPGASMPPSYNYYIIGIFDPGRPTDVDPYHKTVFIMYSPYFFPGVTCSRNMVESGGEIPDDISPICITEPCAAIVRMGARWAYDTGSVICESRGNELFMSIQRKVFEPTSMGSFVAYSATGIIVDLESSIISDYSPSTAVYPRLVPTDILPGH